MNTDLSCNWASGTGVRADRGRVNSQEASPGTSAEGQRASLEIENRETSLFKKRVGPSVT